MTRAVHLEVAQSLETDSFIMAPRRMMARRGKPRNIYSDNGTNFVGAERELKECLDRMEQTKISDTLSQDGIQWFFNPPSAPHFGGVWERLVKSAKKALKITLNGQLVNDETLLTFMAETESLLNSRPLTHVSVDPQDFEAITPNHFLIGRNSPNVPPLMSLMREIYVPESGGDKPRRSPTTSGEDGFVSTCPHLPSGRSGELDLKLMFKLWTWYW